MDKPQNKKKVQRLHIQVLPPGLRSYGAMIHVQTVREVWDGLSAGQNQGSKTF